MSSLLQHLRRGRGLPLFAAIVVGFMVLVIVQGAIVRATGSGNGCGNHWPLCNGDFIPHHPRIATIIEFMHRSLTGALSTLVIALITWVYLARPVGHIARRAVTWCGVLLFTEALLGAILVKGAYVEKNASNMRVFVQCVHFSNTMLLLAAMSLTWWFLRDRQPALVLTPATRIYAWLAIAASIITGAAGSVAALADTIFPSTSLTAAIAEDFSSTAPLLIRMRWLHPAIAILGLAAAILLLRHLTPVAARWLTLLIVGQLLLGVGDVLLLAPTWLQAVHLLGADLYWIALVSVCSGLLTPNRSAAVEDPAPLTLQAAHR